MILLITKFDSLLALFWRRCDLVRQCTAHMNLRLNKNVYFNCSQILWKNLHVWIHVYFINDIPSRPGKMRGRIQSTSSSTSPPLLRSVILLFPSAAGDERNRCCCLRFAFKSLLQGRTPHVLLSLPEFGLVLSRTTSWVVVVAAFSLRKNGS